MQNETTDPMQEMNMRWPMIDMTLSVINLVIVIPVALSLMCLLGYQLGLLSENVTTIEDYEREVLKKRAKQQGKRVFQVFCHRAIIYYLTCPGLHVALRPGELQ